MAAVVAKSEPATVRQESEGPRERPIPPVKPWLVGFYRVLTAMSAWIIVMLHIFRPNSQINGLTYVFFFCCGVVIFCSKVRGIKVFTRTPVDLAFVIWMALAVASQLWASVFLNRVLTALDIGVYLELIMTLWMMFRAGFALCMVDPRTATGAFIKAVVVCLGMACILGILQGYGPGGLKAWAIHIGTVYGTLGGMTDFAASGDSPRPIALFSGPNFFGFLNLVGMSIIIGLTYAQGRMIKSKSVWLAAFGLSLFLIGTIAAQSRAAIAVSLLLILVFMFLMIRIGRKSVVITGLIAVGVVVVSGLMFLQHMKLDYLESTFQKKITDDNSFQEREIGFNALKDQVIQLAPLGAAFTSQGFNLDRTGDVWDRTNGIDDAYFQAYINHGIPGLLQLLFFFCSLWWALKLSKRNPLFHIRALRSICAILLIAYVVYSFTGVRHAKLETGAYLMLFFGLLYGAIYGEKFFGDEVRARYFGRRRAPASLAA